MWVWNTPGGMSEGWRNRILDTMQANGFNMAYVDGTDIWWRNTQAEPERTRLMEELHEGLRAFIVAARAKNIGVEVTFGYKNWGEAENRWKPLMIVDKVIDYNNGAPENERVCGIQSDIEPYLMGNAYENNKAAILGNYLVTMDQLVKKLVERGSSMSAHIVIPHFYDPQQAWTPNIAFNGKTQSTYEHLLDILRQVQDTSISIMAYRNFLTGEDGVVNLVTAEMNIAKNLNVPSKIVIAQEVGCEVTPRYTSWCGKSKSQLENALTSLRSTFATNPHLGGFAVNYIDPYIEL